MRSITNRTAVVAATTFVIIALALSLAGPVFLRSSLISQVDDGLISWNADMRAQAAVFADLAIADGEPGTYWTVVDSEFGVQSSSNLASVDVESIATTVGTPHTIELPTAANPIVRTYISDFDGGFVFTGRDLAPINDTVATVRLWGVALSILLGGVVFFLTKRAASSALAPMHQITETVNGLGPDSLSARVPVPATEDEVAALATTMNRMLGRVEASVDRQSRFAADASHELRSPLASIKTQLDVAAAHPETVDPTALVPRLSSDIDRATALVNDLLALARSGSALTHPVLVDLDDVVLSTVARTRQAAPDTRIDTSHVTPTLVRADAQHVERIVQNLVTNAIRHASSHVAIGTGETVDGDNGAGVELVVDDDGAGIALADRERIFEPFTRLDEARSRDAGGSGLGLALVAELAAANGGIVDVSQSPTGGARFLVRFPPA